MAEKCIFCQIVDGRIPADIVYQDNHVIAFKDIKPVAPVHILIIPRKHISDLTSTEIEDKELMGHIVLTAAKIAANTGIDRRGFRLVNNCKQEGGQVVYHLHFHLIGGRQMTILG